MINNILKPFKKGNFLEKMLQTIATLLHFRHKPYESVCFEPFRKSGQQFQENETHQGIFGSFHAQPQSRPGMFPRLWCHHHIIIIIIIVIHRLSAS